MRRVRWLRLLRRPSLVLVVRSGNVRAELRRAGGVIWAAESAFSDCDDLASAIAAVGQELPPVGRRVKLTVEVEPPLVQVRTLDGLPPVRTGALQRIVAHQSVRYFRTQGAPLVTAAAWVGRSRSSRVVRAAALPERWAEAIAEGARQAGLTVETIRPAGDPSCARLRLLPPGERARARRTGLASIRRLAVIVLLLWAAVGALRLGQLLEERRFMERRLTELHEPAAAVGLARRALGRAAAMVDTMAQAQRRRGALLALAGELTARLPDSAYLTSLQIESPDRGVVTGGARSAATVLAAMEGVPGIANARFEGPVVRETVGGQEWDRFTVRFGKEKP